MNTTELSLSQKVIDSIRLINQGKYFEAHEELEIAWREETRSIREFYQGLLLVSVMNYHTSRGNHKGAARILTRSIGKLLPFLDVHMMIDLPLLVHNLQKLDRVDSKTASFEEYPPLPLIMIPLRH